MLKSCMGGSGAVLLLSCSLQLIANKITKLPEHVGSVLHKFVRMLCAESKDFIIGKSQVITNSLV